MTGASGHSLFPPTSPGPALTWKYWFSCTRLSLDRILLMVMRLLLIPPRPVGRRTGHGLCPAWCSSLPGLSASGLPLRLRATDRGQAGAWEGSPRGRCFPQGWPCHWDQGSRGLLPRSLSGRRVGWHKRPASKDEQARGRVAEAGC